MWNPENVLQESILHLQSLIRIPSFSDQEDEAADLWEKWLKERGAKVFRHHNNIYSKSGSWTSGKPILLLNSHLDTVRPVQSYSRNPFSPDIEGDLIYGLGSNDAGASGVSLASTFLSLYDNESLPVNLLLAITASEERMGEKGMRSFLPHLREEGIYPDMAIVGEPTDLQPAIAERGLVVLDAEVKGKSGHAARNEGINAIYLAIEDIWRLKEFSPDKTSDILGPIKVSVTMIDSGTQHNVVPDRCRYVVDVRTTDAYSNEETVELLQEKVKWSRLSPRSTRIRASVIDKSHPLVKSVMDLGLQPFVSPTTSDMSLMHDLPSLKIGPGRSERSHSADEFIKISEIENALKIYPALISGIKIEK